MTVYETYEYPIGEIENAESQISDEEKSRQSIDAMKAYASSLPDIPPATPDTASGSGQQRRDAVKLPKPLPRYDTDDRADWRKRALCRQEDPDLFFPVNETTREGARQVAAAKAICRACPVIV